MASTTDKFSRVSDSDTGRPVIAQLAAGGKSIGATSISLNGATNWTTLTKIHFAIYNTTVVSGKTIKDTTTQTEWTGTLSGTTVSNLALSGGTDQTYLAGAYVELTPTDKYAKDLYDGLAVLHNPDGTFKTGAVGTSTILADSIVTTTKLADVNVTYAKLLSTIFSGQVASQTNAGSAGGTIYYVNLGGIKLAWGVTATQNSGSPGNNYGVTFPASFFTTIQTSVVTPTNIATVTQQQANIISITTTVLTIVFITTSAATQQASYLVIGT